MKRYTIKGRYGNSHIIEATNDTYNIRFGTDFVRESYCKDGDGLSFVDPSGGPFIGVGMGIQDLHHQLPSSLKIKHIDYKGVDVGYVLSTEPMTAIEIEENLKFKKEQAKKNDTFRNYLKTGFDWDRSHEEER